MRTKENDNMNFYVKHQYYCEDYWREFTTLTEQERNNLAQMAEFQKKRIQLRNLYNINRS